MIIHHSLPHKLPPCRLVLGVGNGRGPELVAIG
jgi:hypothetical protein